MRIVILFLILPLFFFSCGNDESVNTAGDNEAEYVLPYPVGKSYKCSQGFNGSYSHYGSFCYSVDFLMPIGILVTAARAGRVIYIVENYSNDDHIVGHENVVIVMHEDSTYARYVHLTTNGGLVKMNQRVAPGDTIGLSGNSGNSSLPHLHFDVTASFTGRDAQTIPFKFKNVITVTRELKAGFYYEALPY